MRNLRIEGRRWRDRVNGNTYHSARVFADGRLVHVEPFQYGYGSQYEWSAFHGMADKLAAAGMPLERYGNGNLESAWTWAQRHGIDYEADVVDMPRKRDVVAWGTRGDEQTLAPSIP